MSQPTLSAAQRRDAFVERMLRSAAGAFDIFAVYLGDRLGYYETMAGAGPLTSGELAARTGTHERYAREWLEQQTVTGVLDVEDAAAPADQRRFSLPEGHDEALADRESLNYIAPLAQLLAGAVHPLAQVVEAYRTGAGVPYAAYGQDLREGQGRMNRAMLLNQLGQEYLPAVPDVHARLQAGARVADIGCGVGWSAIGIARSYPTVEVDGFDLDVPSVEAARQNARDYGVDDRVRFHVRDAGDPVFEGAYDLVTAVECVHDMGDPVTALAAMRRLVSDGGAVLVVDERVNDHFTPADDGVDGMMYGWSVLHCLPVGVADCGAGANACAATGTVMRTDTLRRYARSAGFDEVEVLPLENYFFRFYRLRV